MKYSDDRQGSKLLFLTVVILGVYLAAFNFNVPAAAQYTIQQVQAVFGSL